jgi:putative mRNA 3-end processing factor
MIRIEKSGHHGIVVPDYNIGLDVSTDVARYIFISHAHADHVPFNRNLSVFATPATAALMRARGFKGEVTELDFHQPMELDGFRVTFYPAGHILGSAMTYIETEEGNLLYTGDFRTPPSPCTEGFDCPTDVDVFITEATFSLPIYRWKSHEVLFNDIREFVRQTRKQNAVPIFLTYNLGKAQEVMMALEPLGVPVQVHGAAMSLCKVYEEFGMNIGPYSRYNAMSVGSGVLITPMSSMNTSMIESIKNKRIAYCSGWAALESRRMKSAIDKMIPLSDHIDFFELIELCKKLNPKHVYITHTPNPDVVQHYLSEAGISSSPLGIEPDTSEE